jgi:hypothetical protein
MRSRVRAIPVPTEAAPEPSEAAGEPLVTGGQGTRRRLTAAGIAEVERLIRAGLGDAEIAGRVGMDRGAIRQRRLKLEKSLSPQALSPQAFEQSTETVAGQQDGESQQHLTIEQTRQIDEMLKAGRSAEEIMTIMGRPIPTMEEIKQRLLDENPVPPPAATD